VKDGRKSRGRLGSAALALLATASACGPTTDYAAVSKYTPPPKSSPKHVAVLLREPKKPFQQIGLLSAEQSSMLDSSGSADLIAALREEGASRGCDAVWLQSKTKSVHVARSPNGAVPYSLAGYTAVCIVYVAKRAPPPMKPTGAPSAAAAPDAVAGFTFGMSQAQARTHCEGAEGKFGARGRYAACRADSLKIFARGTRFNLTFCDDELCVVDAVLDRSGKSPMPDYRNVAEALQRTWGAPTERTPRIADACAASASLYACLHEGKAEASFTWLFPGKHSIVVRLEPNDDRKRADVHVEYRKQPRDAAPVGESSTATAVAAAEPENTVTAERACVPGQSVACVGPHRCEGFQVCAQDGSGFDACQCD
jgi:hypothetical protein